MSGRSDAEGYKKSEVGHPIEEIVKDSDVVDCYQYGLPFAREEQRARYQAWLAQRPKG